MKFFVTTATFFAVVGRHGLYALAGTAAEGKPKPKNLLRRANEAQQARPCTVVAESGSRALEGGIIVGSEEDEIVCHFEPEDCPDGNCYVPLEMTDEQKAEVIAALNDGEWVSEETVYDDPDATREAGGAVRVPPGKSAKAHFQKKPKSNAHAGGGSSTQQRRNLRVVVGDLNFLVVKVFDKNLLARTETPAQISDDVFGTTSDPVNIKSQMFDCSYGQTIVKSEPPTDVPPTAPAIPYVAPGVVEITLADIDIKASTSTRTVVRNAAMNKLNEVLQFTASTYFDYVMFVLEGCYVECGWAAYAGVNSWYSFYQGVYYKQTGVQMHELGHNFNLAHSGGLNGATYTDHTCLMGNPLYSDDTGKMCWNPAKNWQLSMNEAAGGWYARDEQDPAVHLITVDPVTTTSYSKRMVGIADYENNPDNHAVVLKIESGTTTDLFVGFNRATGMNSQNDEADDEVTVVEAGNNGVGYSQSYLKATLLNGESFTFTNWGPLGSDLTITAEAINLTPTTGPGYADVSITYGNLCTVDTDCDDGLFCNGEETCIAGTCAAGTPVNCDDGTFCNGVETCDESADACAPGTPPTCDDGDKCNGDEFCNTTTDQCEDGVALPPCGTSFCGALKVCQPSTGLCIDDPSKPNNGQDGICSPGEDCNECPQDCVSGTVPANDCGNGICEDNEDCLTCPQDCSGSTSGNPSGRYCCHGGPTSNVQYAKPCDDAGGDCDANGCSREIGQDATYCCGNSICEEGETHLTCAVDGCVAPPPTDAPTVAPVGVGCDTCPNGQTCCSPDSCATSGKQTDRGCVIAA